MVALLLVTLTACDVLSAPPPTATPNIRLILAPTATLTAPALTAELTLIPPTLTPTAKAQPSTTPAPLATPADGLTPTATLPATPDPNLSVRALLFSDPLDGSVVWDWEKFNDSAATFSLGGGQLNAVMLQPNVGGRIAARTDQTATDQQLRLTARANLCYGLDEYGLIFRGTLDALNNYNYYVFKLNCNGAARVELIQNFKATVLVDWTPAPASVPGAPAENTLLVWAAQSDMRFYINDRYLASATDDTLLTGFWGVYVRDRTNGGASFSFLNFTLRAITRP